MKQIAKKITEYVKKSKKAKLYGVFGLIYLIAVIFVMNDAWLYQTPIAKLTKVETSVAGESKSTRGTQEIKYKQKIPSEVHHTESAEASFLTKNLSLGERPV